MAKCLQKFLPQAYTTVSSCQEKKGSVRTKRIEAFYTKWGGASVCQGPMRRWGDEESGRGGDEEMVRWGDWKIRREGESPMWRWGDGENFYFSVHPSSFFLLPSSFFLLTNSRVRHPRVQWPLQVGNWEQRVQAKQEECPDLRPSC